MPRKIRPIRIEGNLAYVPLTKGYEAVIDADSVYLVEGFNWTSSVYFRRDGSVRAVYAYRMEGQDQRTIKMHRLIAGTPDGMTTDHIDGDGLNNRRANLRHATHSQNGHNGRPRINNTSGVKGVWFDKVNAKWCGEILVDRKKVFLGRFTSIADAAAAVAKARAELHGEFGRIA